MTDWAAFAGITAAVLFLLLALAHLSQGLVRLPTRDDVEWLAALPDGADHLAATARQPAEPPEYSAGVLYVNVVLSQGLFGVVLLGGVLHTGVPAGALGAAFSWRLLAVGLGFGLLLSAANTVGGLISHRLGHTPSEGLRRMLAPDSLAGWAVLLGVVLPVIAGFEELLFRGALVGVLAAGFGLDPWLLAVLSSVAFALGHGAQGAAGVVVTGALGLVLAAGFVLTGSLLVVVVAHYVVNAAEFLLYEGLGVELWQG